MSNSKINYLEKINNNYKNKSVKLSNDKKEQLILLLDSQTSLILHKNAILNYVKEIISKEIIKELSLKKININNNTSSNTNNNNVEKVICINNENKIDFEFDIKSLNNEYINTISKILINLFNVKKENDNLLEKLNELFDIKQNCNITFYKLDNSIELKKQSLSAIINYNLQTKNNLKNKIIVKKQELEDKIREHDNYITNNINCVTKENYIHYPTKFNIEIYDEKIQCLKIIEKLTIIMDNEKHYFLNNQEKIKDLTKKIDKFKRNKKINNTEIENIDEELDSPLNNYIDQNDNNNRNNISSNKISGASYNKDCLDINKNSYSNKIEAMDSDNFNSNIVNKIDNTLSYKHINKDNAKSNCNSDVNEESSFYDNLSYNLNNNNIDITFDENFINFPNKLKPISNYTTLNNKFTKLNLNLNKEFNTNIVKENNINNFKDYNTNNNMLVMPKLNFNQILDNYKKDKSVYIKENKSIKESINSKQEDDYKQILINLLKNDKTNSNNEANKINEEINDIENKLYNYNNKLLDIKNTFKSNKAKNVKLNESINNADKKLAKLKEEIINKKENQRIKSQKDNNNDLNNTIKNKNISKKYSDNEIISNKEFVDSKDEIFDDVEFDLFDFNLKNMEKSQLHYYCNNKLNLKNDNNNNNNDFHQSTNIKYSVDNDDYANKVKKKIQIKKLCENN